MAGSSRPPPLVVTGQSRLGAVAEIRSTTTAKDLHMFCLSFCLQGVQLLFSQILQYILKLRKELQLGQVRKHPCVISLLRDIPGCPVRSVTYVTRHKDSWSWIGPLNSLTLPLWIWRLESDRSIQRSREQSLNCGIISRSAPSLAALKDRWAKKASWMPGDKESIRFRVYRRT